MLKSSSMTGNMSAIYPPPPPLSRPRQAPPSHPREEESRHPHCALPAPACTTPIVSSFTDDDVHPVDVYATSIAAVWFGG